MTFSTLTFNMQNGQPWNESCPDKNEINLERTGTFLREQNTDVIFLQEVERGHEGGDQVNPPPHHEWLRKFLPEYNAVFAYPVPNPQEIPFGLGLAIFSKSDLENFERIDLPPAKIEFDFKGTKRSPSNRLLIKAETVIQGRPIHLLNTHLQAFFMLKASSADHRDQRNIVEMELRKQEGPALLAGDMNSAPGEGTIEQFAAAGFRTVQNKEITWRRRPFVVDHILYNKYFHLEAHSVIPTLSSDHHALRADFSFV